MYRIIGADGKEYGPANVEQLRQWLVEGRVSSQTRVQAEGSAEWKPLANFPELVPPTAPPFNAAGPTSTTTKSPTNGLAVTGLVMGILTWTFGLCCGGPLFAVLGIIFSSIALSQIKKSAGRQEGRGVAMAGLILSIAGLVVTFALLMVFGMMGFWEQFSQRRHF